MRIWSIHPQYLDAKGLVALWRETLLAKNVLEGKTKGYKNHPQLDRFKSSPDPLVAIHGYLYHTYLEAQRRGYKFDSSKFSTPVAQLVIPVTTGQLAYEWQHLLKKLETRDPDRFSKYQTISIFDTHPSFQSVEGEIAPWEVIDKP